MRFTRIKGIPVIVFIVVFLIPLISLEVYGETFSRAIQFLTDSNFRSYHIDNMIEAGFSSFNVFTFVRFWSRSLSYDYMITFSFSILQILLVVLACIPSIFYFDATRNEYQYSFFRRDKYSSEVFKTSFGYALRVALPVLAAFLIWNHLFYILLPPYAVASPDQTLVKNLFVDIVGNNMYLRNPYLYYVIEGIFKFLIFPIIYTLLTCYLSILFDKKYQAFFLVVITYFVMSSFSGVLYDYIGIYAIYFSPSLILSLNSYHSLSTLGILFSLVYVVLILILVKYKVEKQNEI